MNEIVEEWIHKAEGDYRTALREMAATEDPNYDAVCFHAQQCIEKLVKAALIAQGVVPPKTHDLHLLCLMLDPGFTPSAEALPTEDLRYRLPLSRRIGRPRGSGGRDGNLCAPA